MRLDLSTVGISCMACGAKTSLEEALQTGWKQCDTCQFFICPTCLRIVRDTMRGRCPSFSQGVTRHTLHPVEIPTERLLLFVRSQHQQGRTGPLIQALFYTSKRGLDQRPPTPPEEEGLTREEVWRRYGLVLVRRVRGRWVTWEKVGGNTD